MASSGRFLKRQEIRDLNLRSRRGDQEAAATLLDHSVRCGHKRLALRRFFIAHALGVPETALHFPYCEQAAREFSADDVVEMRASALSELTRIPSFPADAGQHSADAA